MNLTGKMKKTKPRYLQNQSLSDLKAKAEKALDVLADCTLCPRQCHVNRTADETGFCRTGKKAVVASHNAHFGEESVLVGSNGSGTIFFTHCNLMCNFCQNYDISHEGVGYEIDDQQLAGIMLELQNRGCHNINFVTPTHVVPQILVALGIAAEKGLHIPLVYNSSGYDSVRSLAILEGVIDIYMPDFKFWDDKIAEKTCQAADYPQIAQRALVEMHRQVGDLKVDHNGLAYEGLLVRHLVLPEKAAGTRQVMAFIAANVSSNTYVNIMPQYRPCGQAAETPPLDRAITTDEYESALDQARTAGIKRFDKRTRTFIVF